LFIEKSVFGEGDKNQGVQGVLVQESNSLSIKDSPCQAEGSAYCRQYCSPFHLRWRHVAAPDWADPRATEVAGGEVAGVLPVQLLLCSGPCQGYSLALVPIQAPSGEFWKFRLLVLDF